MGFEIYKKGSSASVKTPVVTVQRRGVISLNDAAFKLLGEPIAVQLLHDSEANLIALRGVDESDLNGYATRRQNPAKGTGPVMISAGAFARDCGIDTSKAHRWTPEESHGMLVVDLNTPGEVVISNRERGRLAREAREARESL